MDKLIARMSQHIAALATIGPWVENMGESIHLFAQECATKGWTQDAAEAILNALKDAIEAGKHLGEVLKPALEKALAEARKFAQEHPELTIALGTVAALLVMAQMYPLALRALGFGVLGPVGGSWAAVWQSSFPNVPKGAFFALLQSAGMTI